MFVQPMPSLVVSTLLHGTILTKICFTFPTVGGLDVLKDLHSHYMNTNTTDRSAA